MEEYNKVFDVWCELYPPTIEWNSTKWRQYMSQVKKIYFDQGYSADEIADAIRYCKMRNRNVYSLGYLAYVIDESKMYWTRKREQDERDRLQRELEQSQPIPTQNVSTYTVGWLRADDGEEEIE